MVNSISRKPLPLTITSKGADIVRGDAPIVFTQTFSVTQHGLPLKQLSHFTFIFLILSIACGVWWCGLTSPTFKTLTYRKYLKTVHRSFEITVQQRYIESLYMCYVTHTLCNAKFWRKNDRSVTPYHTVSNN